MLSDCAELVSFCRVPFQVLVSLCLVVCVVTAWTTCAVLRVLGVLCRDGEEGRCGSSTMGIEHS